MTDTQIDDGLVFPEDSGTGLSSLDNADYDSAGYFGLLAKQIQGQYVGDGLSFSLSGTDLTISAGHSYIELDSVSVQSGSQDSYDATLPSPITTVVVLPTELTVSLDSGTNDIYLAFDPTSNDSVYIRHGTSVSEPSDPSLQIGIADTSSDSTTEQNRFPDGVFESLTINELLTDPSGTQHTSELADISDLFSGDHGDLFGIGTSDHHAKTTTASDISDVSPDSNSDAHHSKYTDGDARGAIQAGNVTRVSFANIESTSLSNLSLGWDNSEGGGGSNGGFIYKDSGGATRYLVSSSQNDYTIQKDGSDSTGVINFKTS